MFLSLVHVCATKDSASKGWGRGRGRKDWGILNLEPNYYPPLNFFPQVKLFPRIKLFHPTADYKFFPIFPSIPNPSNILYPRFPFSIRSGFFNQEKLSHCLYLVILLLTRWTYPRLSFCFHNPILALLFYPSGCLLRFH